MNAAPTTCLDYLPPELVKRLADDCDRFEASWKKGPPPRIEDYLVGVDDTERTTWFRHLLDLELHYRWRLDKRPTPEEYRKRFPGYESTIDAIFAEMIPPRTGDAPDGSDGVAPDTRPQPRAGGDWTRYPDQNSSIAELLEAGVLGPPSRPGTLACLGQFDILDVVGSGGMGVVLRARDSSSGGQVAIKLLHPRFEIDSVSVTRFLKEAGHMLRLTNPHILKVIAVGEHSRWPYYVMPYLPCGSLSNLIHGQPLDPVTILRIARNVAEALSHAHGQALIHRDLKPGNILLDEHGEAYLADFGLVLSQNNDTLLGFETSHCVGTAPYMSPGVAAGRPEAMQGDIYSFGAVLREMLTGQPPYLGATAEEVLLQVRTTAPDPILVVNPRAHPGLTRIAEWAMERELCNRYASMAHMIADLNRVAQGRAPRGPRGNEPEVPTPETSAEPGQTDGRTKAARITDESRPGSKNRWAVTAKALGSVACVALVFAVIGILSSRGQRGIKVTNLENEGEGSLRQAILQANEVAKPREITFASGLTGTIQLGGALPDLVSEATIRGPGPSKLRVRRNSGEEYSILTVARTGRVELSGLTISDGLATNGGGINNAGALMIRNCDISRNRALQKGGGIYNAGTLAIDSSTLTDNFAKEGGGGICITDTATVTIRFSLLDSNTASFDGGGNGGGIYCDGPSTLTLLSSTLAGSSAYNGGGVYCSGIAGFAGKVTIDSSTVTNNRSLWSGGGILFVPSNTGTLLVRSSTISGNSVEKNQGGGIAICGDLYLKPGVVTVRVLSSTISGNCSGIGGGIYSASKWAGFFVDNTIIANNSVRMREPDVHGAAVVSGSHNLIGTGTGMSGIRQGVNGNRVGTDDHPIDPKLGPLLDNGGPTFTHALQSQSPALDSGDNDAAPATDQRGLPRVFNRTIDVGAYELQQPDRLAIPLK